MSQDNQLTNPFRVNSLTVRNSHGQAAESASVYEMTKQSVHPVRVTGRDRLGRNIEETVNIHYSQKWMHPSGTINNVVMRTGAIFSNNHEAVQYEHETTAE